MSKSYQTDYEANYNRKYWSKDIPDLVSFCLSITEDTYTNEGSLLSQWDSVEMSDIAEEYRSLEKYEKERLSPEKKAELVFTACAWSLLRAGDNYVRNVFRAASQNEELWIPENYVEEYYPRYDVAAAEKRKRRGGRVKFFRLMAKKRELVRELKYIDRLYRDNKREDVLKEKQRLEKRIKESGNVLKVYYESGLAAKYQQEAKQEKENREFKKMKRELKNIKKKRG